MHDIQYIFHKRSLFDFNIGVVKSYYFIVNKSLLTVNNY